MKKSTKKIALTGAFATAVGIGAAGLMISAPALIAVGVAGQVGAGVAAFVGAGNKVAEGASNLFGF